MDLLTLKTFAHGYWLLLMISKTNHPNYRRATKIAWGVTKATWNAVDTVVNKDYVKGYKRKDGTYVKGHYRRKHN